MTGSVRASSSMAARSKECRRCQLTCSRLRKQAFVNGYDITLTSSKLNAYG